MDEDLGRGPLDAASPHDASSLVLSAQVSGDGTLRGPGAPGTARPPLGPTFGFSSPVNFAPPTGSAVPENKARPPHLPLLQTPRSSACTAPRPRRTTPQTSSSAPVSPRAVSEEAPESSGHPPSLPHDHSPDLASRAPGLCPMWPPSSWAQGALPLLQSLQWLPITFTYLSPHPQRAALNSAAPASWGEPAADALPSSAETRPRVSPAGAAPTPGLLTPPGAPVPHSAAQTQGRRASLSRKQPFP